MNGQHVGGWVAFIAALGMVAGLLGAEVAQLQDWGAAITPAFVGKGLIHVAAAIAAFTGGRLLPQIGQK